MTETPSQPFRDGDVVRYTADRGERHCREWTAVAHTRDDGRTVLRDTYWSSDQYVLSATEIATAELRFNLGDYRELSEYESFDDYMLADRQTLTSQHGLRVRKFLRHGAEKDWDTIIANSEAALQKAEDDLASAARWVDSRKDELERTLAARLAAEVPA